MNDMTRRRAAAEKYPPSIRILHWLRAFLVLCLIATGWYMTRLSESDMNIASFLYPNHKQFGVLVWLLALVHLALRWRYAAALPRPPDMLTRWEKWLSQAVHRLLMTLTLLVPLLGYSLSSSFAQSDGVPFFFVSHIPEILPKNDTAFVLFQALHKYAAYLMLACIFLHVAGAVKHRLQDKRGETDVLSRML
ncbi:cytochrome b [Phyllobacterium myrsinacearum]|uniref:Cytochrome b561 n=1 Tax=Phyllobacterium myrsinacearum TaxID=28101 RepID=A0A839EM01_9HYPH|nr:cytochrome b [Phyllobacterium myrsinacearum]MBA8879308.1 cytochrome b561 [Phyllobacterium myrsinacearum]